MNTFETIQNEINILKETNQEAGNQLHDQFLRIANNNYSAEEASDYLKTEDDVCLGLEEDEYTYSDARNIQDAIITFVS